MLRKIHLRYSLAHHGRRLRGRNGVSPAARYVAVPRPSCQVVKVLPFAGVINLQLDERGPVGREDDVVQPRAVRADLLFRTKARNYLVVA